VHAAEACAWIRRTRSEGREWEVLPAPSVPELIPRSKGRESGRWGGAKGRIVAELGFREPKPVTHPLVLPERVHANEGLWRRPVPAEFYVDFETTLDLYDDFSAFPEKGAAPLIYMTGCGWLEDPLDPSTWQFRCFVTDRLTEEDEARTLDAWISFLREAVRTGGSMRDIDVMAAIERYNEIDCRVMAEILAWLRLER
jgi:hypothetical protein